MSIENDFTLKGYGELLCAFRDAGYECVGFPEADPQKQHLIVRHDVDFSTEYCLPVARLENELGFQSTYYFLMTSQFYNPNDATIRKQIRDIAALGHTVGLHFDTQAYDGKVEELEAYAVEEVAQLARVSNVPVNTLSFHRPSKELIGFAGAYAGCLHAYHPRFVDEICYVSDSRGAWRYGHPLENEKFHERLAMQILTHPIWWFREERQTPVERLQHFLTELDRKQHQNTALNCIPYKEYLDQKGIV